MNRLTVLRTSLAVGFFTLARTASAADPQPAPPVPATANAADKPGGAAAEARVRYERGKELFEEGDYKLAVIEFERAYAIAPTYQVLYNIGQVNYQINNYARAMKAFQRYLDEGGERIDPQRRSQVEVLVKQLASRTAHLTVASNAVGAQISIDDAPVGVAPLKSFLVDAGQHHLVARKAGMLAADQNVVLAAGDDVSVQLDLTALPSNTSDRPKTSEAPTYYWVGWTGAGVAAAGAVATGIASIVNYNNYKDALNTPAAATDTDGSAQRQEIQDARGRTQTFSIISAALGGVALATAGVTLYFTLHNKPKSSQADLKAGFGLGQAALYGSF